MKTTTHPKTGIILLAAGQASRMGMPKQLLVHQQEPLIRHQLKLLLKLQRPVGVVLGARANLIKPVITDLPVEIVVNEQWKEGMGTSLIAGLSIFRHLDGILFCVVDQPYVSETLLQSYLETFADQVRFSNKIIAARYENGRLGVPALFGKDWFTELSTVNPQEGARSIIRREKENIQIVDFPKGIFDLDRPEDWDEYLKK